MKKTTEENMKFWDEQTRSHTGHAVSWWDVNMKKLEIEHLTPFLKPSDYVLDVGCSNGSSTLEIQQRAGCRVKGVDYSAKSIQQTQSTDRVEFAVGDILQLNEVETYDKIYSIRCLINLMTEESQQDAIRRIHRALKPKGLYLMAEAFWDGLQNLNRARAAFNLDPLEEPDYNLYIREGTFEKSIEPLFHIIEIQKYSSLYYLGTRVFQYLALDENPTESDTALHRFFSSFGYETKHSGDFSPQKLYVLEKI